MIIDVKATKTAPVDQAPANRFVLKSMEKRSKVPFVIGALLASIVLYLKSFLSGSLAATVASPAPRDDEAKANRGETEETVALLAAPTEPTSSEASEEAPAGSGSGSRLIDTFPPMHFSPVQSPTVRMAVDVNFRMNMGSWEGVKPLIIAAMTANDNSVVIPPDMMGPGGDDNGYTSPDHPDGPRTDEPDGQDESCGTSKCEDDDRINRAPRVTSPIYLLDVSGCAIFALSTAMLLKYAVDPDGDALSITGMTTSHGQIRFSDGHWQFQSEPKFQGVVTLNYAITDGQLSVSQVAYVTVQRNLIEGTEGADNLAGTDCGENIHGGSGDDNIYAMGGDDIIHGGDGDDHILAGAGDDIVFGGRGNDHIFGGDGNDHLAGGDGNDVLYGDDGDDILFGDAGDDTLYGGAGNDVVDGGDGDDTLYGGTGNDVLSDGAGSDRTFGGDGDDLIIAASDQADDMYDGGIGFDTLDYSATRGGVTVNLAENVAYGEEIGTDSISCFEAVVGGDGNDHFIAADAAVFTGGAGDDVFEFIGAGETGTETRHTILDFEIGDRIRMSKYEIFEKIVDTYEDDFEAIYGDDFDHDDIPIRYRHDRTDELSRTFIEADLNRDGIWESTVMIDGARAFVVIEHA